MWQFIGRNIFLINKALKTKVVENEIIPSHFSINSISTSFFKNVS